MENKNKKYKIFSIVLRPTLNYDWDAIWEKIHDENSDLVKIQKKQDKCSYLLLRDAVTSQNMADSFFFSLLGDVSLVKHPTSAEGCRVVSHPWIHIYVRLICHQSSSVFLHQFHYLLNKNIYKISVQARNQSVFIYFMGSRIGKRIADVGQKCSEVNWDIII